MNQEVGSPGYWKKSVSPSASGSVSAQSFVESQPQWPQRIGPADPLLSVAGMPGHGTGAGTASGGGGAMASTPRTAGDIQAAAAGRRLPAGIRPPDGVGGTGVCVRVGGRVRVFVGEFVNVF